MKAMMPLIKENANRLKEIGNMLKIHLFDTIIMDIVPMTNKIVNIGFFYYQYVIINPIS